MNRQELIKLLACPKCHHSLEFTDDGRGLLCGACQMVYPVEEEIPVLLIERAIPAADWPPNPE